MSTSTCSNRWLHPRHEEGQCKDLPPWTHPKMGRATGLPSQASFGWTLGGSSHIHDPELLFKGG
eukprot:5621845-Amphidinium_carterae.1